MNDAYQVNPGAMYQRQQPGRNEDYLKWIRKQPCVVCGSSWNVESAHTGAHGLGQKSSDLSCLPLCRKHHRTADASLHVLGPVKFAELHQLDIPSLIARFNRLFQDLPKYSGSDPMHAPESCDDCGAGGELYWQDEFKTWCCADCFAQMSMIVEAEANCPVLYEQVTSGRKTVGEIADLMAEHECSQCCPRKSIDSPAPADPAERAA